MERHQNDTADADEIDEGAMRRLITNLIRLLIDHSSTIFLCRVPGRRAIGK